MVWQLDETTGNVVHYKRNDYDSGIRYITRYDGDMSYVTTMDIPEEITESATNDTQQASGTDMDMNVAPQLNSMDELSSTYEPEVDIALIESYTTPIETHHISSTIDTHQSRIEFGDINMDGAMDMDDDDDNDDDESNWERYLNGKSCVICQYTSKKKTNVRRHIFRFHMTSSCRVVECNECKEKFSVESDSYDRHIRRGHVDLTEMVITRNEDDKSGFTLIKNRNQLYKDVYQIVFIPWINNERESVQLSIGVTQFGNVKWYASGIWTQVTQATSESSSV